MGHVLHTDPAGRRVREALAALEVLVVVELFPSATTELAHVVLPGAAFHYPETRTNDVTTGILDRVADTPEYKLTPVRVERSG